MIGNIPLRTLLYDFLASSKLNGIQIAAFSLVNTFRYSAAVPLSTLKVWKRILYSDLKRTRSHCSRNKGICVISSHQQSASCTKCLLACFVQHSLYVGMVEKTPPPPLTGQQCGKMEPKTLRVVTARVFYVLRSP